jgi:signal transduction histidine kinase/ActR/RegA family two-component response regulator
MKSSQATSRLLFAGAALTALLLANAWVAFMASRSVEESAFFIRGDAVPGSIDAHVIRAATGDGFRDVLLALSADGPADKAQHLQDLAAHDAVVVRNLGEYRATELINPTLDSANVRRLEREWNAYLGVRGKLVDLLRAGRDRDAHAFFHESVEPALNALLARCDELVTYNHGNVNRLASEIASRMVWLRRTIYFTLTLAVVCGVMLALNLRSRFREERELAQQRLRFGIASRSARLAMWVRDFNTGVIEWSNELEMGSSQGAGGFPCSYGGWLAVVHPEDRSRTKAVIEKNRISGDRYEIEYRIVRKDDATMWIREVGDSSARFAPQGIVFGVIRDITDQKRSEENTVLLEAQLRQAQKLEAIGTLAGGIAHDFNNVLTGIVGNAELARIAMREHGHGPVYGAMIETILSASRRAGELVRQILAFSRRAEQSMDVVSVQSVATEVLSLIRSTVPASIEIVSDLGRDIPMIVGDSTQIHQVLVNLCTNSVHAMRGTHGRMELRIESLTADVDFLTLHPELRPGTQVRLSVSDTGHGMEADVLKHIFEPFYTTKPRGEGTGLGLSVVHGIVNAHGGGIYCYSRPGEGTVFHVYLPAVPVGDEVRGDIMPDEAPHGNGEKVLLVDDEDDMRRTSVAMLRRLGYAVEAFASANEALASFHSDPSGFDLVITDLAMPAVTGLEFAAEILRAHPGIPIVLITGFAGNLTEKSLREIGFNELLLKPLTMDALGRAVHRALHPADVGAFASGSHRR